MLREVYIDGSECTGCELCADALPSVFSMKGGVSTVQNGAGAEEREIQEIIENCPAECIHWK